MVPPFIVDGWRFLDTPPPPRKKDSEGNPENSDLLLLDLKYQFLFFSLICVLQAAWKKQNIMGSPTWCGFSWRKVTKRRRASSAWRKAIKKNLRDVGISEKDASPEQREP